MRTIDLTNYESVTANAPANRVSDKYRFIPTTTAIKTFAEKNWMVSSVRESKTKVDHRRGFQKHSVRFRHTSQNAVAIKVGGIIPEIVLLNAHDGSSSFWLTAAFNRLVCSNGLVVAESLFASIRIKHLEYNSRDIHEAIEHIGDTFPRIIKRVEQFQQIQLSDKDRIGFAEEALAMRHGQDAVMEGRVLAEPLLIPIREADSNSSLWSTYNTVQEKITQGAKYLSNNRQPGNPIKTRGINSVKQDLKFNQNLWELTEEMANMKMAA